MDADNYLLEVSRYLHLNCVRVRNLASKGYQERWNHAMSYGWSSLPGYVQEEKKVKYLSYDMILSKAGGRQGYQEFMSDGVRRGLVNPFSKLQHRLILGDYDYIARVKRFLRRGSMRDQPAYRSMVIKTLEPAQVLTVIIQYMGIDLTSLKTRRGNGVIRGIAAELVHKYCDISQSQIGVFLGGIDYGAVHLLRRRLRERMEKDSAVRKQFAEIEEKISDACRT